MTRMTDDRIGDVYYDASRSDETVSLKGLRAVADAAERRVLDELWKFLDDLRLPGIKADAVATKLNEMRGDDD